MIRSSRDLKDSSTVLNEDLFYRWTSPFEDIWDDKTHHNITPVLPSSPCSTSPQSAQHHRHPQNHFETTTHTQSLKRTWTFIARPIKSSHTTEPQRTGFLDCPRETRQQILLYAFEPAIQKDLERPRWILVQGGFVHLIGCFPPSVCTLVRKLVYIRLMVRSWRGLLKWFLRCWIERMIILSGLVSAGRFGGVDERGVLDGAVR